MSLSSLLVAQVCGPLRVNVAQPSAGAAEHNAIKPARHSAAPLRARGHGPPAEYRPTETRVGGSRHPDPGRPLAQHAARALASGQVPPAEYRPTGAGGGRLAPPPGPADHSPSMLHTARHATRAHAHAAAAPARVRAHTPARPRTPSHSRLFRLLREGTAATPPPSSRSSPASTQGGGPSEGTASGADLPRRLRDHARPSGSLSSTPPALTRVSRGCGRERSGPASTADAQRGAGR